MMSQTIMGIWLHLRNLGANLMKTFYWKYWVYSSCSTWCIVALPSSIVVLCWRNATVDKHEEDLKTLLFKIILNKSMPKDKTKVLCTVQIMATSCAMALKHKCVIVSSMIKDPTCFKFNQAIVAVGKFQRTICVANCQICTRRLIAWFGHKWIIFHGA